MAGWTAGVARQTGVVGNFLVVLAWCVRTLVLFDLTAAGSLIHHRFADALRIQVKSQVTHDDRRLACLHRSLAKP